MNSLGLSMSKFRVGLDGFAVDEENGHIPCIGGPMTIPLVLSSPVATTRGKVITVVLGVGLAVALPQVLHLVGAASGVGPALGQALLPMFLPVVLAGLLAGRLAGVLTGAVSPVVAFALSGMPALPMLLAMSAQLAVLGLAAGFLASVRMPVFAKVLVALAASWVARLAVTALAASALGGVWDALVAGWPGMVVQLVAAPLALRVARHHAD
jgi:hypothetical protein